MQCLDVDVWVLMQHSGDDGMFRYLCSDQVLMQCSVVDAMIGLFMQCSGVAAMFRS